MQLGRIKGSIVATRKLDRLTGVRLVIMEPLDSELRPSGPAVAAIDVVHARLNDVVYWVGSREAAFALSEPHTAVDVAIVGIVDSVNILPAHKSSVREAVE